MDKWCDRSEQALSRVFITLRDGNGPPKLGAALRYAVFPGGARLRPRLCLAVAHATGDPEPRVADAAAAALELLHCASLVHDDLPCFDDAELRRGRASVHSAFDEATAVLVGDALIALAFEVVGRTRPSDPSRVSQMVVTLARRVGHPHGIIAGQGWESEPNIALFAYHRAKTAALFEAACELGAITSGSDPEPFRKVGELLGRAYQVADDLADRAASSAAMGKRAGNDERHGRPNAVKQLGHHECVALLERLVAEAIDAVPACPGQDGLREFLRGASLGVMDLVRGNDVATLVPRAATA